MRTIIGNRPPINQCLLRRRRSIINVSSDTPIKDHERHELHENPCFSCNSCLSWLAGMWNICFEAAPYGTDGWHGAACLPVFDTSRQAAIATGLGKTALHGESGNSPQFTSSGGGGEAESRPRVRPDFLATFRVPLLAGELRRHSTLLADSRIASSFRQAVLHWRFRASSGTRNTYHRQKDLPHTRGRWKSSGSPLVGRGRRSDFFESFAWHDHRRNAYAEFVADFDRLAKSDRIATDVEV